MTVQTLKKKVDEILNPPPPKKEVDTGAVFTCPECGLQFVIVHVEPGSKHKFEKVTVVERVGA
jgi:hypothetical protein